MKHLTQLTAIWIICLVLPAMAAMAQEMPAQRRTLTETKMQQIAAQRMERLQEMHPERFEGMDRQGRERIYQQELQRLQHTHNQQEEKRTQRLDSLRQVRQAERAARGAADNSRVSETDSLALVAFYYATNGDYWYNNDNWLTGPVDTWYGVDAWDGAVEGIYLYENNLSGFIPEEIGDLSNLYWLELTYNNLSGEIPWTIGDCWNLEILIVSYNQLTYIPESICDALGSGWGEFYFEGNYFDLESCPAIECLAFMCVLMWEGWQNNGYDLFYDCLEPPVFLWDDVICADGSAYDFPEIFWFGYPCISWDEWQTSGTGYFDDPSEMYPVYFPSVDDYQQGCIEIYIDISSNFGYWLETMELCFDPAPQADAGADTTIYENETWPLSAAADHYSTLLWESDGDGTFAPSNNVVNPVYTPGPGDIAASQVALCLTAYGLEGCSESEATDCMTLSIIELQTQIINLQQGWTGISSYLIPDEPAIDELMAAIQEQLIILMDHDGNHYQPSNKNLFNWEHNKGYYIKLSSEATLEIGGLYPLNKALQLQQGWNLIPVLSDEPEGIEELFYSNTGKVEIVMEVAGLKLFWPDMEIATLQELLPGKAYLVKAKEPFALSALPSITTAPVTDITLYTAISGGEVTDEGSSPVTVRGVVWGVLPNPTTAQHDGITADGEGAGVYVSELTGLTPVTTYYLRAYATNHVGTEYGEQLSFFWECSSPFIDPRNGQTYETVQIGSQCWMAENLNIGTRINGSSNQSDNGTIEKYCYGNSDAQCDTYGGLYQWNEMMQYTTASGVQGICPVGWHLPTDDEWKTLEGTVDSQYPVGDPEWDDFGSRGFDAGLNLKSTSGWNGNGNGTDLYGFSALPGGGRDIAANFNNRFDIGSWWSSSEMGSTGSAWRRMLHYDDDESIRYSFPKEGGFSVRCLRD